MKYYYVYILKCSDGSFYTGMTNNISRRFIEHQKGLNEESYTFSRRPVQLVFYQEFLDVEQAIFFEKKIKKWSRAKKNALSQEKYDLLQKLSQCQNKSHCKNYKKD